jgi:hypothetical protein
MKLALQVGEQVRRPVDYRDRVAVEIKPRYVSWIRLGREGDKLALLDSFPEAVPGSGGALAGSRACEHTRKA